MNSRQRFLAALSGKPLERPPVWLMRQAGRYLPEYRALKTQHSFREMVSTPALATEVTMQPFRRFPLDAAIIFSDILVIPEALGFPYHFRDTGGIELPHQVRGAGDLARIDASGIAQKLAYVGQAIRETREVLGDEKALIGFCGAPWTIALYMMEGGAPGEGAAARRLALAEPDTVEHLIQNVVQATRQYVRMQVEAGVDAVQVFDSWAGLCPAGLFERFCLQAAKELVAECGVPVIYFARGAGWSLPRQVATGASCLGVDWATPLSAARELTAGRVALQGNLDPLTLELPPEQVKESVDALLRAHAHEPGWVFNLGHGLTPQARPESVAALVESVVNFMPG